MKGGLKEGKKVKVGGQVNNVMEGRCGEYGTRAAVISSESRKVTSEGGTRK